MASPRPPKALRSALVAIAALFLPLPAMAGTVFDPTAPWRSLETPHFRINYDQRQEAFAQRIAVYAEDAYREVTAFLKSAPPGKTEIALIDTEDTSNGAALPYPTDMVYLYTTSSDEDSLEGRYDSYFRRLITHEFTHICHFEATGGLTDTINRFFGRAVYPNFFQPYFLIEGLAVTSESRHSPGGRAKEGDFDMILRCAALADQFLTIDQAGSYAHSEWPGGMSPYIYGTAFYEYLMDRYGADAPLRIAHAYGEFPWLGVNAAISRALPGKTAYGLWNEMLDHLRARARRQLDRIEAHPLTASTPVTTSGYYHRHPAWTPEGKLIYAAYGPNERPEMVLDDLNGQKPRRLFGKSPFGAVSISANGFLYLNASHEAGAARSCEDLYRYDLKTKRLDLLTSGKRATDPAVSPDGRWVIAGLNRNGTRNLALFDSGGTFVKDLTRYDDESEFSGTTWSPDGQWAACSAWRKGSRDLYLFKPGETEPRPLWRDAAVDVDPHFSPDGHLLYFASDRMGGVFNLFAYRLADRKLFQITNVPGGAIEPAPSPDGKRLAFTEYSAKGWDIRLMPIDPAIWREVALDQVSVYDPATGDERPAPTVPAKMELPGLENPFASHAYNPWPSFSPKTWSPVAYVDESSYLVGATTIADDVLLQHYAFVNAGVSLGGDRPYYSLYYSNDQLPPTLAVSLSDLPILSAVSTKGPGGTRSLYDLWQRQIGGSVSVTYPGVASKLLGLNWITGQSLTLGYGWQAVGDLGMRDTGTAERLQPVSQTLLASSNKPPAGQTNSISLTYQYADNYKSGYAASPESGGLAGLSYQKAGPWFGGTIAFDRLSFDVRRYVPLPAPHQTLALRAAGGASFGGATGNFLLGGSDSTDLVNIIDQRYIGGVGGSYLRGYGAASLAGNRMVMGTAEYRFPILEVQHGFGTVPLFVTRLSGALFADAGMVGRDALSGDPHLGLGVEARIGLDLLNVPSDLRVGLARGTHPTDGLLQSYAALGISF
jgi:hypothetical protein